MKYSSYNLISFMIFSTLIVLPIEMIFVVVIMTTTILYGILRQKQNKFSDFDTTQKLQSLSKKYKLSKTRCDICGKDAIKSSSSSHRVCSHTCGSIANKNDTIFITSAIFVSSWIFTPMIMVGYFILPFALYGIETDTYELRTKYIHLNNAEDELIMIENSPQSIKEKNTITLEGTNYLICCYQTARLQEKFCYCGRGIGPNLISKVSF